MIAERVNCRIVEQNNSSGRQLRNRLIAANSLAWIVIILLIRLLFF